jgi:hypothetical protein
MNNVFDHEKIKKRMRELEDFDADPTGEPIVKSMSKLFDEMEMVCAPYEKMFIERYGDSRFDARRHTLHEPIVMYQSAGQPYPIHYKAIWNWGKIVAIVKIYPKNNKA